MTYSQNKRMITVNVTTQDYRMINEFRQENHLSYDVFAKKVLESAIYLYRTDRNLFRNYIRDQHVTPGMPVSRKIYLHLNKNDLGTLMELDIARIY